MSEIDRFRFNPALIGFLAILMSSVPLAGQGYLSAVESNKKVVFDFYRLVIEPRNPDLIEAYVAPDFLDHDPSDQKGSEAVIKLIKTLGPSASQDIASSLQNPPAFVMAEGDLVTWIFRQPTSDSKDKSSSKEQLSLEVYRIKDHKIVEHWKGVAR